MVNTMRRENIVIENFQPYDAFIQDEIGQRIKKCRLDRHMTPSELACAMCYETTSPITKIENGTLCLSIDRLYELAQILDVSTDYLLFGNNRMKEYNYISTESRNLSPVELEVIKDALGIIIEKLGEGAVV